MVSKILIKLVDQAIIPAILLLVTRVISVIFLADYFKAAVSIDNTGFVFADKSEYFLVNTYSIFVMLVVIAVGLLYVLIKSFAFHDSHISPSLTTKLFSLNVASIIQGSFDLYSQGTVWISYLYLMFFVSATFSFFGLIDTWVVWVAFVLTILITVLFIIDVEHEIKVSKGVFDDPATEMDELEEEYVLKFGASDA